MGGRWDELIGREAERLQLRGLLSGLVAGHGGVAVLVGPPGIGRTALVRDLEAHARSGAAPALDQLVVSMVVGAESERDWPFAGLDLVLSSVRAALAATGPAETVKRLDELIERMADGSVGTREQHALTDTYEMARRSQALVGDLGVPALLLVDDVHQLDSASQDVLGFLARRSWLGSLALVVTATDSADLVSFRGLPVVHVGELSDDEAVALVQRAVTPQPSHGMAAEIAGRVGGNPRSLLDVTRRIPKELAASGELAVHASRVADLTDSERRIAALVAAGKRNREIAAELFISVRTVEAHLGKIYRKAGVRSRTELAGLVASREWQNLGTW